MKFKNNLARYSLAMGALLVGQYVSAHDEIKNTVLEGSNDDNVLKISHGCEVQGKPIIAQSVVIPSVAPQLSATNADGSSAPAPANLSAVIANPTGLAGLVDVVQNRDIFLSQAEKYDTNGNVIGFYGTLGQLSTTAQGRVPFEFTAPFFVVTSCYAALNVQIAVADICITTTPTIRANKVNLWIPDNGSVYATQGKAQAVDGIGEPPVIQVQRDLVNNPLPSGCPFGLAVTVTPSAADVNVNLGIPGWHY